MKQKRIVIVNSDTIGSGRRSEFILWCEILRRMFLDAKVKDESNKPMKKPTTVQIVNSAKEATDLAVKGMADVIVFVSEEMLKRARLLKRFFHEQNMKTEVLIFADTPMDDEPYFMPGSMVTREGISRWLEKYGRL